MHMDADRRRFAQSWREADQIVEGHARYGGVAGRLPSDVIAQRRPGHVLEDGRFLRALKHRHARADRFGDWCRRDVLGRERRVLLTVRRNGDQVIRRSWCRGVVHEQARGGRKRRGALLHDEARQVHTLRRGTTEILGVQPAEWRDLADQRRVFSPLNRTRRTIDAVTNARGLFNALARFAQLNRREFLPRNEVDLLPVDERLPGAVQHRHASNRSALLLGRRPLGSEPANTPAPRRNTAKPDQRMHSSVSDDRRSTGWWSPYHLLPEACGRACAAPQ